MTKFIVCIFIAHGLIFSHLILFDFNKDSSLDNWFIVNDDVMGGRSQGYFELNRDGHAAFYGDVSLENNGGFSSVRYDFPQQTIEEYSKIRIRVKGDGKRYQFRLKSDKDERHSYVFYFETTGAWQTVSIPLAEMEPSFRGRTLNIPNYAGQTIEEIAFLISNSKAESFKLLIDQITLE